MSLALSKIKHVIVRSATCRKNLLWQVVAAWVVLAMGFALEAKAVFAQNGDDGPVIEVVPILATEQWTGFTDAVDASEWMMAFPAYAQRFWDDTSNRRLAIQFRLGVPIRWQRCADCRVSAFDEGTLAPWILQLAQRQQRPSGVLPRAYLLLLPKGGIVGAGFYIPEKMIAAHFGVTGFDMMVASGPQAALHEVGHFLGLPDRYDPHGSGGRVLTLMGWIDDPVAPLDPVLRAARGWAAVRHVRLGSDPETKTLYPEDVIKISVGQGAIWLGLQPIPGPSEPSGWLFEVDWTRSVNEFERVAERLLARSELDRGQSEVVSTEAVVELNWRFIPEPARLQVSMRQRALPNLVTTKQIGCGVVFTGTAAWGVLVLMVVIGWVVLCWRRQRV